MKKTVKNLVKSIKNEMSKIQEKNFMTEKGILPERVRLEQNQDSLKEIESNIKELKILSSEVDLGKRIELWIEMVEDFIVCQKGVIM